MANELSGAELVFVQRMLPHFLAGKTAAEAAAAVLDDDARILAACFDRSHSYFVPTADERGSSGLTRVGKGDVIAQQISATVYERLRT